MNKVSCLYVPCENSPRMRSMIGWNWPPNFRYFTYAKVIIVKSLPFGIIIAFVVTWTNDPHSRKAVIFRLRRSDITRFARSYIATSRIDIYSLFRARRAYHCRRQYHVTKLHITRWKRIKLQKERFHFIEISLFVWLLVLDLNQRPFG